MNSTVKNIALTTMIAGTMFSAPKFSKAQNIGRYCTNVKAQTELAEIKPAICGYKFEKFCSVLGFGVLLGGAAAAGVALTKGAKKLITNIKNRNDINNNPAISEDPLREVMASIIEESKASTKEEKNTTPSESIEESEQDYSGVPKEKQALYKVHDLITKELVSYRETGKTDKDIFENIAMAIEKGKIENLVDPKNIVDLCELNNLLLWATGFNLNHSCKDYEILLKTMLYFSCKLIFDEKDMRKLNDGFLDVFDFIRNKETTYDIALALSPEPQDTDIFSGVYSSVGESPSDNDIKDDEKNIQDKKVDETEDEKLKKSQEEELKLPPIVHKKKITFKDVGGQDEAIELLKKGVLFPIKYPKAFARNSIKHGFVLYGPPGTGKSLIAEALANESKAAFLKFNPAEMESKYVGETEANWRKIIEDAKENQPCIIFLDEFDALARNRSGKDVYGDKTLNQVLSLISDIEKNNDQIYFIAATNKPEILDSAVIRSGRFGTMIKVKEPDNEKSVKDILNIYLKKYPTYEDIDLTRVVPTLLQKHANGADIASVVEEAYENAMERSGIYKKMEFGTYKDEDSDNVIINTYDIDKAVKNLNKKKEATIGFKRN